LGIDRCISFKGFVFFGAAINTKRKKKTKEYYLVIGKWLMPFRREYHKELPVFYALQ